MFKRLLHFGQKNILNSKSVPSDVKSHHKCCTFFGLKQLTVPTRVTSSSSTIIDHILAGSPALRVIHPGVIDISFSDHHLIYCTRQISRMKRGPHEQMKFRSFKHYKVDLFE